MLMECLPGNVAMDLNFAFVPTQYKSSCYSEMARFQVEINLSPISVVRSNISIDRNLVYRVPQNWCH